MEQTKKIPSKLGYVWGKTLKLEKQINRNLTALMKEIQLIEGQSIDSATLVEDCIYNTIET